MLDKLLAGLTDAQKKAVLYTTGPLLVIAGPGSGKTRVITYRIAALIHSGVKPFNICAITFTNKAADEMRLRLLDMNTPAGAQVSTFHSFCVRILRRYANYATINPNFTIYDRADQVRCVKQALKNCETDSKNFPPSTMLEAVSALKNKLVNPDDYRDQADDFFAKVLEKIYRSYQKILTENNALDFDDLLMKTALLLQSSPLVRNELADRFKFLLIDEYQDTNHAQYSIAKAIASQHNNICATGDPDQSIYRWRGADIRNILDFEHDFPNATVIKLEKNFRSPPNILEAADSLIAANKNRKQKILIPTKPPCPQDVTIDCFEDETEETAAIAEKIEQLRSQNVSLRNIAVFYRVNAASRPLEEALIKSKIPYQIVRGVEFYSRKEIRDVLAYLKILVNHNDEFALRRAVNSPPRGIGKITLEKAAQYARKNNISVYEALRRADNIETLNTGAKKRIRPFIEMIENFKSNTAGHVAPLIEGIFEKSSLAAALKASKDGDDAVENVRELVNAAADYDRANDAPCLIDYLQQISLFSDTDSYDTSAERVALMTLHTAKGLEFDHVFITSIEEDILPHTKSSEDHNELEEERRLFFVGITRAKQTLSLTYARYRTIWGQLSRTIPSRFLYELGLDFQDIDGEKKEKNLDLKNLTTKLTGSIVEHSKFGTGRVKKFVNTGQNSTVTVKFKTGQTKTLMLKYANLTIL